MLTVGVREARLIFSSIGTFALCRATMRENALKGLHKLMCNNFFGDVVQDRYENYCLSVT